MGRGPISPLVFVRAFAFPSLAEINKIEHRHDVCAMVEAILEFDSGQEFSSQIVPAELTRKFVPNARLHLVWPQASLEAPVSDVVIAATLPHALAEVRMFNPEQTTEMSVQS